MTDFPWSKFFWADWEADQALRLCSLAAQGLWMRMLCVCARSEPYGYLAINDRGLDVNDIARLAGVLSTEADDLVDELERNGVFSRDRKGRIYSRRLVRDRKRSDEGRKHVKKRWGQTTDEKEENRRPNRAPNTHPKTQKPEARSQREEMSSSSRILRFEEFWQAYPHRGGAKKGKAPAQEKYRRAVQSGVSEQTIIEGAIAAHRHPDVVRGYARDPATWIHQRGWQDEIGASAADPAVDRLVRMRERYA